MTNNSKQGMATIKLLCAVIFLSFTILYIYCMQSGLLTMTQYAWSGGRTHYNAEVGCVIIVLVASLVVLVTCMWVSLPKRAYVLNYFTAFLSLGLLTAADVHDGRVSTSPGVLLVSGALMLVYVFVVSHMRSFKPFLTPLRGEGVFSQLWFSNLCIMLVMMVMTICLGNTDRTLHTRLNVENLCHQRQWESALAVGVPQYDNDSSLTMLRALALANTGELGEKLFKYNIVGSSQSLLPRADRSVAFLAASDKVIWSTIGRIPRDFAEPVDTFFKRELRRGTVKPVAKDYLLTSYLLDRDLKSFMAWLPRFYEVNDSMPQHYQEAYVLYCRRYHLSNVLEDKPVSTDFADFTTLHRKCLHSSQLDATLRSSFFGTYWYYYYSTNAVN